MGTTVFFARDDGIHGEELWKSDGTPAGTVMVKNINPNDASGGSSHPTNLMVMGGRLFFTADDGSHGRELWTSDGSRAGTVLVKNINPIDLGYDPGYRPSYPSSLTAVGGRLFFTADDGTHGEELWTSDGSRAGTILVKDISPTGSNYLGSYPSSLTVMGGRLFFAADDGTHGEELWKSDGSRAGTVLVKDVDPTALPSYFGHGTSHLTVMGDRLFFVADDGAGRELWKSDGSRVGTVRVSNIDPSDFPYDFHYSGPGPSFLTVVGDRLFFAADDDTHGQELWKSDGTEAGTVLVKDIRPGTYTGYRGNTPWSSSLSSLTAVGGRLFFVADDGTHGKELWKSNGSRAGTVLVKDIHPGSEYGHSPDGLTAGCGWLFFFADDGVHGRALWKSNGSRAGTVMVMVEDTKTRTTR